MYTIHSGDGGQHMGEEKGLKSQNSKGNATSLGNRKAGRKKSSERKNQNKTTTKTLQYWKKNVRRKEGARRWAAS